MNLTEAINTEIGTPPPPSFELQDLIRYGLERRARTRRIGVGVGIAMCAAIATTAALAPWPHHSSVRPTATTPPTTPSPATSPSPTFPLPTRSWPVLALPTGVPPSLDAILDRIGPNLGVPAGTKFEYTDLGGTYKIVQAPWGPAGSWGNISVDPIADISIETYSCAELINCTEVTGADGSMTYVAGPIVAPEPQSTQSSTSSPVFPRSTGHYAPNNFVYSYHPDGTFVMIIIDRDHTPATLTIEQLVEAGQAFSMVS